MKETEQLIEGRAKGFSKEIKRKLKDSPGVPETSIEEHASIEFSFFSDCFAVSAPVDNEKNITRIFQILSFTSHDLLYRKFLLRGGVTIGKLYHKRGIIFGPAMNEAAELEKEEPHYPCILCSKQIRQVFEAKDYMDEFVLKDSDQKLVMNIACVGSNYAERDLMEIINKELAEFPKKYVTLDTTSKKFAELRKAEKKWKYLQIMLPEMYKARAIRY